MKRQLDTTQKLYTLCMLVQDVPGVLSQVARLFSRKGYNIESIVSGDTDKPGITRITIVLLADELMIAQIAAQCRKLLPVQAVKILPYHNYAGSKYAALGMENTLPLRLPTPEELETAEAFFENIKK